MAEGTHADLVQEAEGLLNAARVAGEAWSALTPKTRAARLREAGKALLEEAEDLAGIVHEETGKPIAEALSGDVLGLADVFNYWCTHGPGYLAPRKGRVPSLEFPGKRAVVEREARGVVAVISPWNYPVALPMRVMVPALLAGNGVVLKPSEVTPRTGAWLVERLRAHLGPIVGLMAGDGSAGAALVAAGPDMVHFTGSTTTGQSVAMACAERGIAYDAELGGKDVAIVLDDVDVTRAAAGIAWGIAHNAGQDCASIERVVVHHGVAQTFVPALVKAMEAIASEIPDLTTPLQRSKVLSHISDAIDRGATVRTGGVPEGDAPVPPTLLQDVPREAMAWVDETFGPVAVLEVHDTEEALVAAANDTVFGLGCSVWSKDVARAERLGRQVKTGMLWVNNTAFTGGIADLPWVGRGASGGGVTSSPESLAHMTRPRMVLVDKASAPEPWWYPYGETLEGLMRAVIERHRSGGLFATLKTLSALQARTKVVSGRRDDG